MENYEKKRRGQESGDKNSVYKEFLEIVGNGKTNGQCVKGDNCSFPPRNQKSVEKVTPSNPSPNSFMQQNERKSSRTRSFRGRSPSGRMSRWPCKDYLRGTCNNSFCEKWHPSRMLVLQDQEWLSVWGKSGHTHIVRLMKQPTKNVQKE